MKKFLFQPKHRNFVNFQVEKRLSDVQTFFFVLKAMGDETQCILVQYYCILPRYSCRFHRFPNMRQSSITTDTFLISLIIDTIYISWRLADRFCCHIPDVFLYGFFFVIPTTCYQIMQISHTSYFTALLHP